MPFYHPNKNKCRGILSHEQKGNYVSRFWNCVSLIRKCIFFGEEQVFQTNVQNMLMQIFVFFIYRFILDIFLSSWRNIMTQKNYRVDAQILGMIYVGKVTQRSCSLVSLQLFKTFFVDFKNDMHMNVLPACMHLSAPYACLLLLNVRRGCLK